MPYVYRVQNEEGRGPYDGYWCGGGDYGDGRGLWLKGHDTPNHPLPESEGLAMSPDHRCGFKDTDQLLRWFPIRELKKLERYGFFVVRTKAKSIQCGERQVIFIPEAACDYSKSGADK